MGSLKKAAKSFGVVCGALISPEVNYDQIDMVQSVCGRTMFPKFKCCFLFCRFLFSMENSKACKLEFLCFLFFIFIYYVRPLNEEGIE